MNTEIVKSGSMTFNHEEIAHLAHAAWQRDGCPEGRDLHYWFEAETQLKATGHLLRTEVRPQPAASKRRLSKARSATSKSR